MKLLVSFFKKININYGKLYHKNLAVLFFSVLFFSVINKKMKNIGGIADAEYKDY